MNKCYIITILYSEIKTKKQNSDIKQNLVTYVL